MPARELQVGDTLLCEDGVWRAVEEVGETGEWQTVYNVRVADYHTYFVGEDASAVWAHNATYTDIPGMTRTTGDFIAREVAQYLQGVGDCYSHTATIVKELNRLGFNSVQRSPTGPGDHVMAVIIINGIRYVIDVTAEQYASRIADSALRAKFTRELTLTGIWSYDEYNAFLNACNPAWHY